MSIFIKIKIRKLPTDLVCNVLKTNFPELNLDKLYWWQFGYINWVENGHRNELKSWRFER